MDERQVLAALACGPLSGAALAAAAGLPPDVVETCIQHLRAAGVPVVSDGGVHALARPLELLEAARIVDGLDPPARALLAGLEVAWRVGSTNAELLARPVPARGTEVLLAEAQTAGRGRRGRQWQSPPATHLYLSLLRGFDGGLAALGGLSLVVGVAVAEALQARGHAGVQLKWPNDLVVDGRKLGGVLIEGGGPAHGPARVVIGIGLNTAMPAAAALQPDQPWIDLQALAGAPVGRNALAAALLSSLLPALEQFAAEGLAGFLPRYARVDALRGRPVRVEIDGQWQPGVANGVAADGALRVVIAGQERLVHAGEVSVRAV